MQIFEKYEPKDLAKKWLLDGSSEESVARSLTTLRGLTQYEAWNVLNAVREESLAERLVMACKECFRQAEPPIDIDTTEQEKIDPDDHIIANSKFVEILKRYNVRISDSVCFFVNKFPKLDMSR